MTPQLLNQVAIVTGAGKGSGEAVAKRLGRAGAKIVVNDINPDRAGRVASEIRAAGGEATAITADVSNKFHCVNLIESARAKWGRLDILINNAHVQPVATVLKMDEWDWERCLNVNLKGVFFMSQLCGRVMADENGPRGGIIINVASHAGVTEASVPQAAFHASKAGVVGFARECAREFAQYGIRVYSLVRVSVDASGKGIDSRGPELAIDGWSGALAPQFDVAETVCSLCAGVMGGSGDEHPRDFQ